MHYVLRAVVYALVIALLYYLSYDTLIERGVILPGTPDQFATVFAFAALVGAMLPELGVFLWWLMLIGSGFVAISGGRGYDGEPMNARDVFVAGFLFLPLALPFVASVITLWRTKRA